MSKVSTKMNLGVPASKVWDVIGGFNALQDWHPAVEKSELEDGGTRRRLHLVGGGEIVEELKAKDDSGRNYTYTILSSPLPVANYKSTITVNQDADGNAVVEWAGEFEPVGAASEAENVIQSIYDAGLQNLKKMMGG